MTHPMNSGEPEPTSVEFIYSTGLQHASELIDEAMRYTKINSSTAPVRYESAKRGVKYAIYTTLGLTGIVGSLSEDFVAEQDVHFKNETNVILQMARFEEFHKQIFMINNDSPEVINED